MNCQMNTCDIVYPESSPPPPLALIGTRYPNASDVSTIKDVHPLSGFHLGGGRAFAGDFNPSKIEYCSLYARSPKMSFAPSPPPPLGDFPK